jgi:hypothetical protein
MSIAMKRNPGTVVGTTVRYAGWRGGNVAQRLRTRITLYVRLMYLVALTGVKEKEGKIVLGFEILIRCQTGPLKRKTLPWGQDNAID